MSRIQNSNDGVSLDKGPLKALKNGECSYQATQTQGKVFYFFYEITSPRGKENSLFREKKFLLVGKSCTQSVSV